MFLVPLFALKLDCGSRRVAILNSVESRNGSGVMAEGIRANLANIYT
jgi:hypothetical protein